MADVLGPLWECNPKKLDESADPRAWEDLLARLHSAERPVDVLAVGHPDARIRSQAKDLSSDLINARRSLGTLLDCLLKEPYRSTQRHRAMNAATHDWQIAYDLCQDIIEELHA